MIRELIGKRVLLTMRNGYSTKVDEFRILEVSPSGNWVKLQNLHGNKFWSAITELSLVEVLIDLKSDRPQGSEK